MKRKLKATKVVLTVGIVLSIVFVLFLGLSEMPQFGHMANPSNNEVYEYYIDNTVSETNATNIITGIILDYRAFDTLMEATVIFTTVIILSMLFVTIKKETRQDNFFDNLVLKEVLRFIVPVLQVFGIYVIINGHLSPGGGFSGGAIIGVSLLLKDILDPRKELLKLNKIIAIAMMVYTCLKGYVFISHRSLYFGDFPVGSILSGGSILILNILVGIVVSLSIYNILKGINGDYYDELI